MLQLPTHTQEENDETLTDLFSTRNVGSSSGVIGTWKLTLWTAKANMTKKKKHRRFPNCHPSRCGYSNKSHRYVLMCRLHCYWREGSLVFGHS